MTAEQSLKLTRAEIYRHRQLLARQGIFDMKVHDSDRIDPFELNFDAFVRQKHTSTDPRYSFVAVNEPVILSQAESICGRQFRGIWRTVCVLVFRSR